ncbi:MAG: T9SS type A sorting domain-containing protein [candidate division WOR-3 bacterium]|nr:T9SS type A sorting domain-containing protein [candidate division WOR-3 bacterium]MCX7836749.1 T9SS type A sorting domain-containing protein [candidate division WOR-3 bacterium]MDW8114381.1 hypothetical protein [candidate division WOR-3 bacterium]
MPESGWIWLREDTNGYWQTLERGNFSYRLISIPFIALQDTPIVIFSHFYETELFWDGGNCKFRRIRDTFWRIINPVPNLGQPYDCISLNESLMGESIYSGLRRIWQINCMKIPVLRNDTFFLCWHYGSDASINYYGWIIDNVKGIGFDRFLSTNIKENYDKLSEKKFFIYDNLGRRIFTKNLKKGVYFLIIKNKVFNEKRKLLIIH